MTYRTTQAFWKYYRELPEQIKKGNKKDIQNLQEESLSSGPSFQKDTFDLRYLLIAHYEGLQDFRGTARQTDSMVLDRFSQRLQQPLETTKDRITLPCTGSLIDPAPGDGHVGTKKSINKDYCNKGILKV